MQPSYYSPVFISQIIQVFIWSSLPVWIIKKTQNVFLWTMFLFFVLLKDVGKATILWSTTEGKAGAGMVSWARLVDWAQAVDWTDMGKKFLFLINLSA